MSQLDFNAGTRGAAFCIPSGKDKVAKATTNIDSGVVTAPINEIATLFSITIVIAVIPQIKNIKDSYKLLNGKYPFSSHRDPKLVKIVKFAIQTEIKPIFDPNFKLVKEILVQ
jgi:hypothetical protein